MSKNFLFLYSESITPSIAPIRKDNKRSTIYMKMLTKLKDVFTFVECVVAWLNEISSLHVQDEYQVRIHDIQN